MAEPDDMILPMLREMRAENAALHAATQARLDALEAPFVSMKQIQTGDSLVGRLMSGEFQTRIEVLERKVRELEGAR